MQNRGSRFVPLACVIAGVVAGASVSLLLSHTGGGASVPRAHAATPHARAPRDATQERAHLAGERRRALAAHAAEPVDASWAPAAARTIARDLRAIPPAALRAPFRVAGVDCRTTRCVATLEWPSYDAARESFRAVIQQRSVQNRCSTFMLLDEPSDTTSAYESELLFDCHRD